jgi:hypothetical protein
MIAQWNRIALILALPLASFLQAQDPTPVASWKLHAQNVLKGRDGLPFRWTVAPDNSILVAASAPQGQWTIIRLTNWETGTPRAETMTFPAKLPDSQAGITISDDPLVDPAGRYVVIRSAEVNLGENDSTKTKWEALLAVVDLHTFTLAATVTGIGALAGDHLFFSRSGTLMLDTTANLGDPFTLAVTVIALPTLDRGETCEYNVRQNPQTEWPAAFEVTTTSSSCPAVMQVAHLSTPQELTYHPAGDQETRQLAGRDCEFLQLSRAQDLALYRCGRDLINDPDGFFGMTVWYALRVLSVPDGKTVFSLPLWFYDSKSSGLFARTNGHNYLVVRHGARLQTYRLP